MAKLSQRVALEFCKRRGPLFPTSLNIKATAKKRLFGSSTVASPDASLTSKDVSLQSLHIKTATLLKVRWRTSLKEVRVTLDRQTGIFQIYCNYPAGKEAHCTIPVQQIESVKYRENENPVSGDRFHFFELRQVNGDTQYFCSTKDIVDDWINDINSTKEVAESQVLVQSAKPGLSRSGSLLKRKELLPTSKVILNHKRFVFATSASATATKNPCVVVQELLTAVLAIFQEFTDNKCVMVPKVAKHLAQFAEQACELQ